MPTEHNLPLECTEPYSQFWGCIYFLNLNHKWNLDMKVASGCETFFFKAQVDLEVASGCEIFFQSMNGSGSC
jgi:hypothetical protein